MEAGTPNWRTASRKVATALGAGDAGVGGDAEGVAGAVVEPAEDLDVGARASVVAGQAEVGEVGLPALVGEVGLEADVGRAGPLGGVGHDEPGVVQIAADRGPGDRDAVVLGEMPGDGVGAGIEALAGQFLPELADQLNGGLGDGGGRVVGASRAWLEGCLAFAAEASDEAADPALGDAVGAGDLTQRAALDDDGGDDETGLRHPADPALAGGDRGRGGRRRAGVRLFLCLETPHSYVLVEHTSQGTIEYESRILPATRGRTGCQVALEISDRDGHSVNSHAARAVGQPRLDARA